MSDPFMGVGHLTPEQAEYYGMTPDQALLRGWMWDLRADFKSGRKTLLQVAEEISRFPEGILAELQAKKKKGERP
jgi:hypothetical protein